MRNYIRQKEGELEVYKDLEIGAQKWCKEHIPRNGNDLTEEGQILLEDPELWLDRLTFSWKCHALLVLLRNAPCNSQIFRHSHCCIPNVPDQ